jgi:hypothetical protein
MEKSKHKLLSVREDSRLLTQALRYGAAAFWALRGLPDALLLKETFGLHYLFAVPIAFVVGIAVNYLVGVLFVFRRGNWSMRMELSLFLGHLASCACGYRAFNVPADRSGSAGLPHLRVLSGVVTYLFNFFSGGGFSIGIIRIVKQSKQKKKRGEKYARALLLVIINYPSVIGSEE